MTLGEVKKRIQELENQGADDDSTVYVYEAKFCDFSHIEDIDYDSIDNSINIYPK